MANMLDYLDWRGDIPFSADPFNEVDSLVLSEAAYVDFEGIVPGPDEEVPEDFPRRAGIPVVRVTDVVRQYWKLHTKEEIERSLTLYKLAPYVLDKLCSGERFGNMMVGGYVNQISPERNEQMSAVTFYLSDGSAFTAFRGTDDTLTGWKEDFTFSFMKETEGQRSAAEYLNRVFGSRGSSRPEDTSAAAEVSEAAREEEPCPVRVGGHSKGGNFAVFAAAFCDQAVKDRIERVYTNDGPGFLEEITESKEYLDILPRVNSVIPEESLFGVLLHCRYYHKLVKSSAKGIWQHDAMSWQIMRNHFVQADDMSEGSLLMKRAIEEWVYGMTLEERKDAVESVFNLLEDTGMENVSEIAAEQFRSIPELLHAYRHLDAEEKHKLHETLGSLFRSGASFISGEIQERIGLRKA